MQGDGREISLSEAKSWTQKAIRKCLSTMAFSALFDVWWQESNRAFPKSKDACQSMCALRNSDLHGRIRATVLLEIPLPLVLALLI